MAIADINEYFDQATDRAIDLREQVKDAGTEIEDLVQQAEKTADRVEGETGDVKDAIHALIERLGQAQEAIATARGEAASALEEVEQQSAKVGDGARQLVTDVQEGLQSLATEQNELTEHVNARLSQLETRMEATAAAAAETGEAVAQGHEETREALGRFTGALETADKAAQDAGANTVAALKSAVEEMALSTDGWIDAMGELLNRQTTALLTTANGMIVDHNASMDHAKSRLGEGVAAASGEPVAELVSAIEALQGVADSHQALLTDDARAIVERIAGALPEIQQLAQWFRDHARLS